MTDSKDDLSYLLGNLALKEKGLVIDEQSQKLQKEIDRAGFRIFECLSDKGYFAWTPPRDAPYKNLASVTKTKDLSLSCIDLKGKPDPLVEPSTIRTPKSFLSLAPQEHMNEFPHGKIEIICLHVAATNRGINFAEVDFAFGGSTLAMLATCDDSDPFMVTCIPGTKTLLITKQKDYIKNISDVGFQFERLMTGRPMDDVLSDDASIEHMHVMNIGTHRVFFSAETDAMMQNSPVEIKASNPRYWGTKVMFQMISSGSTNLCVGKKGRGALYGVEIQTLQQVARTALASSKVQALERNILNGMENIQTQMKSASPGDVFKVSFRGTSLVLLPTRGRSADILPPANIVRELMGTNSS